MGDTGGQIAVTLTLAVIYFIPVIIAGIRHVRGLGQVVVVNLFLGWTIIGWVIALVMAFRHVPREAAL